MLPTSANVSPQPAPEIPRSGPQLAAPVNNDPEIYEDEPAFDPAAQAARRRQANAARYSFAGTPLAKFSKGRKRLLLDIRSAAGAGPIGKMDTLFGDAIRFTWLCLQKDEDLEAMRAGIGLPGSTSWSLAHRFQIAIDRWADANADVIDANESTMTETFTDAWLDGQVTEAIPESVANADPSAGPGN